MAEASEDRTGLARAGEVLRRCGLGPLRVTEVRALRGGMVSQAEEWVTDGSPPGVICKWGEGDEDEGLGRQWRTLRWMQEHTEFPSPKPYGYLSGEEADGRAYLVMERLPGRHLGEAKISPVGLESLLGQLAEHLADLHSHHRETYGMIATGEEVARWLDWFGPSLESNYRDTQASLSAEARANIERLLADLAGWLPECHRPTLVHGDIWHNNVIVDDGDPDRPRVTGYIDVVGLFADVEYELTYLLAFGLVDGRFFEAYTQRHALRDGFARRCRVYWLNTMLLHLWLFGREYLPRCEALAREIGRMVG